MPRTLSVAAVQFEMRPVTNFAEFATQVTTLVDQTEGAQITVFPELFTESLFTIDPDWRSDPVSALGRIADYTDDYRALFADLARSRGQTILAGSHLVRGPEDSLLNVAHLFTPAGVMHTHEKTHIFPAEAEWGTTEGDTLEPIDLGHVTVGIAICYEAEVPEVATVLSRRGAELILSPSYTFTEAGFYRVRHCLAARCIENQVYAVHAPVTGSLGSPLSPGWARASVLGPCDTGFPADGVLIEAPQNVESVIHATLDLDALAENRRSGAATTFHDRQRRAGLYRNSFHEELLPAP
ncbi:MAG: amidohydrolase [Mycolicibacterium neoaurum]|uniref:nitrilase-related carbon-nitrogen hydrolase n=1 Tax=Mycolicibacterium neoaurum TaxID=1795 RepID=UPI002FFCD6DA